ncbi:SGNH/GDSL hydrolase family protein [Granulicella sp. S190]|uniref:SGNH/GDSL hydrolase family protein n=1 Tax=Granulicella sp. S190 TaxID=1747226 RepID=UPI00131C2407|nr:SGNH/GDSL hydrolase family protein [Granulicella sp. S190]
MNKTIFLAAIAACIAVNAHAQQNDFYLHDSDRVVFYGDSITDQRNYTMMIETYVLTRYPNLHVTFTNSGWGGDRVTGGGGGEIDLRLKRDVTAYSPSVVTLMLGMNDGGYKTATEATDKAFFDGFRHIHEVLKRDDPQARITAIEPSPYDNVTRTPAFPVADGAAYNQVLVAYGKWISTFAKENDLTIADANTDFVHVIERANQTNPTLAKEILADHIHPSFGGALMIGEAVLKAWGARPVVASVSIHADGTRVKLDHAEHAAVTDLVNTGGSIRWTETDDALPLPFAQWQEMWGAGPAVGLVIGSSDITEALNREPVRVSGLKDGVYSVRIDGTSIGTFTNDQLAQGVNLALLKTPMTEQAMSVYKLTTEHGDLHYDRWRHVEVPFATLPTAPAAMTSLDALEASVVEKQRALTIPTAHTFEVAPLQ